MGILAGYTFVAEMVADEATPTHFLENGRPIWHCGAYAAGMTFLVAHAEGLVIRAGDRVRLLSKDGGRRPYDDRYQVNDGPLLPALSDHLMPSW